MKPYPAYKDSGLPRLGPIPNHWKIRRLKYAARLNPSKSGDVSQLLPDAVITFLPMENVSVDGRIDCSLKRPLSEVREGFTNFRRGDVVVAKITPCFENGKGACLDSLDSPVGFGTTEFIVLRPTQLISSKLLYYVTKSDPFRKQGAAFMTGSAGQQRVSASFVEDFVVSLPPTSEQFAIGAYLDRKNAEIDQFIAKKRRLIILLNEQKTAMTHRAVTKGLDRNAPMKRSGIIWLGELPASWTTLTLRHLSQLLQTGPFGSQLHQHDYISGGIPVINPSHMKQGCIIPEVDCAVDEATCERLSRHKLRTGDIVFARRGEMGRCAW